MVWQNILNILQMWLHTSFIGIWNQIWICLGEDHVNPLIKTELPEQSSCRYWLGSHQEPGGGHLKRPRSPLKSPFPQPAHWSHPPWEPQTSPGCSPPAWWYQEHKNKSVHCMYCQLIEKNEMKGKETHCVPFPIIQFGSTGHTDANVSFRDLHQR